MITIATIDAFLESGKIEISTKDMYAFARTMSEVHPEKDFFTEYFDDKIEITERKRTN